MVNAAKKPKPVVLAIMDGWGHSEESHHNAIALAQTPTAYRLDATCPKAFLKTSGAAVGLPAGQIGNSEVGHQTIGAGRIVMQDLLRINTAIAAGVFAESPVLNDLAAKLAATGGAVHIIGLVSDGGVHSHSDHIIALAHAMATRAIPMWLHVITDGRDCPPQAAQAHLRQFQQALPPQARIATISGRYFAMDRDNRWQRTAAAWQVMTFGTSATSSDNATSPNLETAINTAYQRGESDEFITPTCLANYAGMAAGDGLLVANFRADRIRQLLSGWLFSDSPSREKLPPPPNMAAVVAMASYSADIDKLAHILFPPQSSGKTLGKVVAEAGLSQLRLAETEKYPHVTFFFNGGDEAPLPHEKRRLIPSPKVATYDQAPAMSIAGVVEALLAAIRQQQYDLIVVNFANPDMVGHTGDLPASIKAVEAVDQAVAQAISALTEVGGCMLLTADHGNCECMWDSSQNCPHTAHTTNPVPLWWVGAPDGAKLVDGGLCDLAPSLLELLGLRIPAEMTGKSLLRHQK